MKNDKIHLIGKYGEIVQVNDTTFKAIITDNDFNTTVGTYASHDDPSRSSVDVLFPIRDLADWIKKLAINTTQDGNIRLGTDFFE